MSRSSHQRCSMKKVFLKLDEMGQDIIVLYLLVSFWYCHICILSKRSLTEVFLKKVFLKIQRNSQESTCTKVSFLSAANNFIDEETPAQCFPKSLTIFAKIPIVDIRVDYKYDCITSRSKTDLQRLSSVRISDKNCYRVILPPQIHNPKG